MCTSMAINRCQSGPVCRGEVVEDVEPPLPLSTPLLLVKPPVGLSTPAVFRALDLGARSTADPQQLLSGGPRILSSSLGFSVTLPAVFYELLDVDFVAALGVPVHTASESQQLLLVRWKEPVGCNCFGDAHEPASL